MRLITILNKRHKFKSFVYSQARWCLTEKDPSLHINVVPRKNSKPICSCCQKPASGYDTLKERIFEFIPVWGFAVFLHYSMRRVNCAKCGIKVEEVPWAKGKQSLTRAYMAHLARWAKLMSWQETARSFRTTWQKVFAAVQYAVEYGLEHRDVSGVQAIGVDEIAIQKGHSYMTVVYQIDQHCTRLLWVGSA